MSSPHDTTRETPTAEPWLVWSYEHDAWWGPNHGGYYVSLLLAGVYSEAEARSIEASANRSRQHKSEEAMPLADALTEHRKDGRTGPTALDYLAVAAPPEEDGR